MRKNISMKLGINIILLLYLLADMSSSTTPKTPTPPTLPPGVTKECHIVKRPDFDGYGFNLHSEKVKPGQFIGKVDENSPAEAAGLKEGDRILEVNGVSIGNETHKQVVARIKAIACEVRLLLIDVDGVALKPKEQTPSPSPLPSPTATASNGNGSLSSHYEGTKQEIPGASTNISSISVVSTKRVSNASSIQSGSTMNASDLDVVDRASPMSPASSIPISAAQNGDNSSLPLAKSNNINNINNNNNTMSTSPPPPSETVANLNNNGNIYSSSSISSPTSATTNSRGNNNTNGSASVHDSVPVQPPSASSPVNTMNRAGGLNLPLTAAEMRAKLASKKKFDPKNESVDLKKKFEIIQKL